MGELGGAKLLAAVACIGFGLAATPSVAQTHEHDAGGTIHTLQLDHGKKWATDEPLRKGMNEIRALIAANSAAIHAGKLAASQYAALGSQIEERVAYIVGNCKLGPAADANLHLVVADLIAGADAMQGKAGAASPRAGASKVVGALDAYGRYFDHPGWRKP